MKKKTCEGSIRHRKYVTTGKARDGFAERVELAILKW